ncbi:phenylalanine--tRNA ligase subunit beta [Patescibacteria group bacterium]|nr:phenylalanine--tRNA ligase subunit beta [Patescibacteria group bacterium]MCG2690568.1 phenylalanine--tRNA ligase subunit beta [Candidatus Parcubacteria bacterium]
MYLSLNWLKDFIDIPKSLSPEELGLKLTMHTVEVDSVEKQLKDVIYDIDNKSITHRPDLWSHYGMAREIAAFLDVKLKKYNANTTNLYANTTNQKMRIDVKIEDEKLCPRYMAVAVSGIKVEPSPEWMRERLIAAGSRPINNIVDITNYVMLELGQPLHAFDFSKISNDIKIIVRKAKQDEVIETLDGEKRRLDEEMLVIADKNKPIAIAGVMGGANSEVDGATTEIILESANFNFISIRKTSQKLGLRTESSIRFEKSLDPNLCELALAKAVELIKKICPEAKISGNPVDEKNFALNQGPIKLNLEWLNKIIGQEIEEKKVVKILNSLGFEIKQDTKCPSGHLVSVKVPTWRATKDISIPEDLLEEVARIYGYGNIASVMPIVEMEPPKINEEKLLEKKIKNTLAGAPALAEAYNYSFVGEEQLAKLGIDCASYVKLANPIAAHQTMLRQSLAPNLIENIRTNQARFERIGLFEIGSICLSAPGEIDKGGKTGENLPYQEKRLGIILAADEKINVFAQAKGIVEYLLMSLDLPFTFQTTEIRPDWADESACAKINVFKRDIGLATKLNSKARRGLGLKKEVAMVEISFAELFNIIKEQSMKKFRAYDKYPPAIRDLAFVVNEKILYNDIRDEIISFDKLINKVELFDVYSGGKLGKAEKNLAFHIAFLAPDRTLTSEEVDELQKRLINRLEEKFEAKIRDF